MTHPPFDTGLARHVISNAIASALDEDLGQAGDITTAAVVPAGTHAEAVLSARQAGIIAGIEVAVAAFHALDPSVRFETLARDGTPVAQGAVVARLSGSAHALLSAERVALNFLCHMSGIATLTARFVDVIRGTRARIVDTRKTTPGLRTFEKYAVRCGGGYNHRAGLFDAILIKDNHIVAAGGITAAVAAARATAGHMVRIEVEVTSLAELQEAMKQPIDAVLLDNMTCDQLREAVRVVNGRAVTEASGGVTLETVRGIAETGVDLISIGALTHSAPALDLGLDFQFRHSTKDRAS